MEHQMALRALEVMSVASVVQYCLKEARGQGLRYSKFAPSQRKGGEEEHKKEEDNHKNEAAAAQKQKQKQKQKQRKSIPSRPAMFIAYAPSLLLSSSFLAAKLLPLAASSSSPFLAFFQATDLRITILAAALAFHFLKRVLEVLFLHKYSGTMELSVSITISTFYLFCTATVFYAQQVTLNIHHTPSIDLMWYGVLVYIVGIIGNFYHHYILASLRTGSSKESHHYVVPQGGLFSLVVCPHYLFESIDFLGLSMIGQTTLSFLSALSVAASLALRSRSTKLWYLEKIHGFPKERKAFLPFLF